MKYQIDQQFIGRLNNLVQEVLSDEARFYSRNDQSLLVLHNRIFSKNNQSTFKDYQPQEKEFFKKYFYSGANATTARADVPFAQSQEDQAFFFDQFRSQVQSTTYNFDRMDMIRPNFTDEKSTTPEFESSQVQLITRGLVYPCMAALEQREIAKTEKQKVNPNAADDSVETGHNPYQNLGDKVLVKGVSGQFDQVLTYQQLELLAAQEELLRSQNLTPDQISKSLREYAAQTFPGLAIAIDEQGKIQTYLGAAGLSASGLPTSTSDQPTTEKSSFGEVIKEMKLRQGRQVQYEAINASNGNLAFTTADFQVKNANGITTTANGMTLMIDQAGQGNNAVFFLVDKQGVMARFNVDTGAIRAGEKPPLNISIYQKPEEDSPASPKLKIGSNEMDKLQKPLLALYAQAQNPSQFDETGEKPRLLKPLTVGKPTDLPGTKSTSDNVGSSETFLHTHELVIEVPRPLSIGFQQKPPVIKPKIGTVVTGTTMTTTVMPKIQAGSGLPPQKTTSKKEETNEEETTQPTPIDYNRPRKIQADKPSTVESTSSKKQGMPKVVKVLAATSAPAILALLGGMFGT